MVRKGRISQTVFSRIIVVLLQTLSACTEIGHSMLKYWMRLLSSLTAIATMAYLDFWVK
jgi:hypothetical protein